MAFLPLFSGKAVPRGNHHQTITLMGYENKADKNNPCPARKFCYIVKCGDLQTIFANAGVPLIAEQRNSYSFWNRRHPNKGKEYGVEICEDDNSNPNTCLDPVYLVYRKHWLHGKAEAQITIYAGKITPNQAVSLDGQLRTHDIP